MKGCHAVVAVVWLASPVSGAGLSKAEIAKLDGHLLIANELAHTINVFPSDKAAWTSSSPLWSYKLEKGKDGLKFDYDKFDDVKRVVNSAGEVCILITGNHGTSNGGLALYNMEKGKFDFSACPQSGFHSADLLPDGNMVVADPTKYLLLMSPSSSHPIQSVSVYTHTAVWDHANKAVWAMSGTTMYKFGYSGSGSKAKLKLDCSWKPASKWIENGHDMNPMNENNKLVFTCNKGIGAFDMSKASCSDPHAEAPWSVLYDTTKVHGDTKVEKAKGIHYNYKTKQFALAHPDKPSTKYPSFRTFQVRDPSKLTSKGMQTTHAYTPNDHMAFRVARWFIDNPFTNPESSVSSDEAVMV